VQHITAFFKTQKYETHSIGNRGEGYFFEAMGDALWLGQTKFILGGYGMRTDRRVYENLAQLTQSPVAIFELKHAKFYHLDTCLSILNSSTALACKQAFTDEGWELLHALFSNLLEVPLQEADAPGFACNAHCPDGKHVIIQKECTKTVQLLQKHNFIPIEVDTSEFIKSGGSVFCMKLMFW
jgi:N-dimethylarginine dimethylaminohydrolase